MRNFDAWLCTPPEPPEATPAAIWRLLIERAERDHATVGHPVNIDEDGAEVPAWTVEDGELCDSELVSVAWDDDGLFDD